MDQLLYAPVKNMNNVLFVIVGLIIIYLIYKHFKK